MDWIAKRPNGGDPILALCDLVRLVAATEFSVLSAVPRGNRFLASICYDRYCFRRL